jgi:hypothetical protein
VKRELFISCPGGVLDSDHSMDITCTQCGAKVPIEHDTEFLRCPYCETALYVETDRTVKHFLMPATVAEKDLVPVLRRKLAYLEIKAPVNVTGVKTVWFPFWRLDAKMGGAAMVPAAAPPLEDMASIKPPAGNLQLYTEGPGRTEVAPEVLLEDAVVEGWKALEAKEPIEFSAAAMLHLPLLEVSYTCRNRPYRAVIEAASGEVYADDWPAAPARKKDRVLGLIAVSAFIAFTLEAALIPVLSIALLMLAATALLVYFVGLNVLEKMGW